MNILFYIDPWIVCGNPKEFTPWLFSLERFISNKQYRLHVCCGEYHLKDHHIKALKELCQIEISFIRQEELREFCDSYIEANRKDYTDSYTKDQLSKKVVLLKKKIGKFSPDIIIYCGGSGAPFFKILYPGVPVLFKDFTMMQAPALYPLAYFLDICGIHNNSFLSKFHKEIKKLKFDQNVSDRFLSKLREAYCKRIQLNNPITRKTLDPENKFQYIIFLPLESSMVFNFFNHVGFVSQFDLICHILDKLDPRVGLVVKEHISANKINTLSSGGIRYLRKKYPNFIYLEALKDSLLGSHFLLALSDAVITVSCSLATQCLLWRKPFFIVGDFYMKHYSDGDNIENIVSVLDRGYQDKDSVLFYMLTHYYFLDSYWKDQGWFDKFLTKSIALHGNIDIDFYSQIDDIEKILSRYLKYAESLKFKFYLKLERVSCKYRIIQSLLPVVKKIYQIYKEAKIRFAAKL